MKTFFVYSVRFNTYDIYEFLNKFYKVELQFISNHRNIIIG